MDPNLNRSFLKKNTFFLFKKISYLFLSLLILISCTDDTKEKRIQNSDNKTQSKIIVLDQDNELVSKGTFKTTHNTQNLADWNTIKNSGYLRIIVPDSFQHNDILPRESTSYNNELKLILRFCEENNLTPIFISTKQFSNILPLLEKGNGDIVVANLTITESRKKQFNFTIPVAHSTEQLVVSNLFNKKVSLESLDALKIGARENTSFWDTLSNIKEKQLKEGKQELQVVKLDDKLSADEKFNLLV